MRSARPFSLMRGDHDIYLAGPNLCVPVARHVCYKRGYTTAEQKVAETILARINRLARRSVRITEETVRSIGQEVRNQYA